MASVTQNAIEARVLWIMGKPYEVEPFSPGEDGTHAFRLCKWDGEVYDLIRRHDGCVECSCPHYEMRLKGNCRTPCKHGRALVDAGLVPDVGCDPLLAELAEDLGPADDGGDDDDDWDDYGRWSIGPEPAARLSLRGFVAALAANLRAMDTDAGDLCAHYLDQLVIDIDTTGATTPRQVMDRLEALEAGHADTLARLVDAEAALARAEAALDLGYGR